MLLKEFSEVYNLNYKNLLGECKIEIIGFNLFYIQNFRKLLAYDNNNIIILVKGREIKFYGENFKIKEMSKTELIINGQLNKIEFI